MANFTPVARGLAAPLRMKIFHLKEWKPRLIGNVTFLFSPRRRRLARLFKCYLCYISYQTQSLSWSQSRSRSGAQSRSQSRNSQTTTPSPCPNIYIYMVHQGLVSPTETTPNGVGYPKNEVTYPKIWHHLCCFTKQSNQRCAACGVTQLMPEPVMPVTI